MNRRLIAAPLGALVLVAALGGCHHRGGHHGKADPAKVEAEVKAAMDTVLTAFNAHDADKAASLDAPDYVGMSDGAPNEIGKDGDIAASKKYFADPAVKLAVSDAKVTASGDGTMAVQDATFALDYTDPQTKKVMVQNGNWQVIFRRQDDGSMKIWRSFHAATGPGKPK